MSIFHYKSITVVDYQSFFNGDYIVTYQEILPLKTEEGVVDHEGQGSKTF